MTKSEVYKISGLFVVWRLVLGLLAVVAPLFLTYDPSFPYAQDVLAKLGYPQWLYSWANFDGVHYLTIINQGYVGTGLIQAFFPVFPLLVKALTLSGLPALLAGLFISNLAALVAFILWYWLSKELLSSKLAWWSLASFILFPTSFYLGAYYTESLFLCFVIGSMLAARKKHWWLAGILAALASGSRVVGILLVPTLGLLLLQQQLGTAPIFRLRSWFHAAQRVWQTQKRAIVGIALGSVGLLAYMAYLQDEFQDALYFFHVQAEFGGIRQETLVLYPQVVWRALKIVLTVPPTTWSYVTYLQEFIIGVAGILIVLWSFKKKEWWPYSLFSLGVLLVPTLTGTFSSVPRYALAALVLFIWIPYVTRSRPWVFYIYLLCSSLLLLINTVLFIQGYWVA